MAMLFAVRRFALTLNEFSFSMSARAGQRLVTAELKARSTGARSWVYSFDDGYEKMALSENS